MNNPYRHPLSNLQESSVYNGNYPETPYNANRPPPSAANEPTQSYLTASRWTSSQGHDGHSHGFMSNIPEPTTGPGGFGELHLAFPYGYDPSTSSPFGCPLSGQLPNAIPYSPVNTYKGSRASAFQTFSQQFRSGPQSTQYELDSSQKKHQQHEYQEFCVSGYPFDCPPFPKLCDDRVQRLTTKAQAEDDAFLQGKQDQQWLRRFLQSRGKPSKPSKNPQQYSYVPDLRQALYRAAQLISQLTKACDTLRSNSNDDCDWTDSFAQALKVKRELQDKLRIIDSWGVDSWLSKLFRVAKRRARRLRARKLQVMDEKRRAERISESEAAIDKWRLWHITQVIEKKKDQELKLAADAVLCEVRKKQADVKRMQDVLRSLEKLRRLRKDAASRKGIVTERQCEEAFSSRLDQLRCLLKRRTAVYLTEEKALIVMLEGEQEEERRREREKQVKKEREKLLQRKHRVDTMLFGDELPADSVLQPFSEYYRQAEHSLHALLQIRREWDTFVVAVDHPDSSPVPESWILPDAPSDQVWASALHTADS